MSLSYYRCDWTHPPSDDPVVIFYEVDTDGRVLRVIDLYADGKRDCVSVKDFLGRESELPGRDSLVEGSFFDAMANMIEGHAVQVGDERMSLAWSDATRFEAEWAVLRSLRG
jgi:hypothetical protein